VGDGVAGAISMPSRANAKLVIQMSDGSIQERDLDTQVVHIGRDSSCEIHIPSQYVSRHHAHIRRVDENYMIEDVRSTNGLLINGRIVREPHQLAPGDCVVLGDVSLTFQEVEDDALRTSVYAAPDVAASVPAALSPDRPSAARPAGLRTILFTDLVDHTSQVTRLGHVAGQRWLRRHSSILREQFERHEGIEEKWTGDGFLVSFDSSRRAVRCAIAIQRALSEHNRTATEGEIHIRMGLNTGEVLREDGELFGNAVILASRVMSEAGPDQVLISEWMQQLVQATGEFKTVDRGLFTLKGFPREQRLFEVQWSGEESDE
jgi:class 3 adenylate cyclase